MPRDRHTAAPGSSAKAAGRGVGGRAAGGRGAPGPPAATTKARPLAHAERTKSQPCDFTVCTLASKPGTRHPPRRSLWGLRGGCGPSGRLCKRGCPLRDTGGRKSEGKPVYTTAINSEQNTQGGAEALASGSRPPAESSSHSREPPLRPTASPALPRSAFA